MATRVFFSRHIPKSSVIGAEIVESDIRLFNKVMHKAMTLDEVRSKSKREATGAPDLRKKANKALCTRKVSAHIFLKSTYSVDDYFANSAVNTAKAAIQSVKELNKLNIDELSSQKKDLSKKQASVKTTLTRLTKIKDELKRVSKLIKTSGYAMYKFRTPVERYDISTGKFQIMSYGKVITEYDNAYLFEVRYVDPKIRRCKNTLRLLKERSNSIDEKIKSLKEDLPGICFGSKKLFKQQYITGKYPDYDTWLRSFRKRREHSLTISGRKDASQGNFLFSYDPKEKVLTYRTQQKESGKRILVRFPGVEFPYGQGHVDMAVLAKKDERKSVCWRISDEGGSFLVQCMVDVRADGYVNNCYLDGCIAMDSNCDNISISELDASGNIKRHKVVYFDLSMASKGHAEHILSKALDVAFDWCDSTNKPFAMEDLSVKHPADRYGNKKKNRITSGFAFSKITALAESKALKHKVTIKTVNPAYTSQTGKVMFMKKYGMSIHEAASAAIGRRAMDINEKLNKTYRAQLSDDVIKQNRWKQWKAAYKMIKTIRPDEMYSIRFTA
ncbi:MAG: hypothetical protein K6A76_04810 [Oribacterium sp.]|nr:hypothetical protein [Oribacterium sp.]